MFLPQDGGFNDGMVTTSVSKNIPCLEKEEAKLVRCKIHAGLVMGQNE